MSLQNQANFLWSLGYSNQQVADTLNCWVIGEDPVGDYRRSLEEKIAQNKKNEEKRLEMVESAMAGAD